MYQRFWLWEARSVGLYEGLRVCEAPSVVFYEGLKLWEAYLYVFYVSRRLREIDLYVFCGPGGPGRLIFLRMSEGLSGSFVRDLRVSKALSG